MPRQFALSSSAAHQRFAGASWDVDDYVADGSTPQEAEQIVRRVRQAYNAANTEAYLFRVELATRSAPRIWREIRIAFGWEDCHECTFTVRESVRDEMGYREPIVTIQDQEATWDARNMRDFMQEMGRETSTHRLLTSTHAKLSRVFGDDALMNSDVEVLYEYDLGDGWEHTIEFLGTAADDLDTQSFERGVGEGQHSFCVDGAGHGITEDCGGEMAWEAIKWRQAERGQLDLWHWDFVETNRRLDHMWVDFNLIVRQRAFRELIAGDRTWLRNKLQLERESRDRMRDFLEDPDILRAWRDSN
ncbi:hypothetical protein LTR85_003322 [Meristemomyces frigidus]|nr:hypothetical protein LTR85_003322 [Meristemomyces frigidus]